MQNVKISLLCLRVRHGIPCQGVLHSKYQYLLLLLARLAEIMLLKDATRGLKPIKFHSSVRIQVFLTVFNEWTPVSAKQA
jgi:hypothetical protein